MIEKTVLDYLKSALDVPVYMEEPKDKPDSFVVLEKTGSGRSNLINNSQLALQSYATSLYLAAQLNEQVKEAMDNIIILSSVIKSSLNSDYNFTDTTTKRYRYQAIYDLVHY